MTGLINRCSLAAVSGVFELQGDLPASPKMRDPLDLFFRRMLCGKNKEDT